MSAPIPMPVLMDTAVLLSQLERAAAFAGTDDTLPAMTCVRIDFDGGKTLTCSATDRYTAARVAAPTVVDGEGGTPWSVLVRRPDVELIVKAYRVSRRRVSVEQLALTLREHQLMVTPVSCPQDGGWGRVTELAVSAWRPVTIDYTVPPPAGPRKFGPYEQAYADLDRLFEQAAMTTGTPSVTAVTSNLLARFAQVASRMRAPLQLHPAAARKALRIQIGDDFTGLLMPTALRDAAGKLVRS